MGLTALVAQISLPLIGRATLQPLSANFRQYATMVFRDDITLWRWAEPVARGRSATSQAISHRCRGFSHPTGPASRRRGSLTARLSSRSPQAGAGTLRQRPQERSDAGSHLISDGCRSPLGRWNPSTRSRSPTSQAISYNSPRQSTHCPSSHSVLQCLHDI